MKILYTLLGCFLAFQLSAQSGIEKAQKMTADFTRFWSTPGGHQISGSRSVDITHQLDSIISRNGFDQVVAKTEVDYNNDHLTTQLRQYVPDSLTGVLTLDAVISMEYFGSSQPEHIVFEGFDADLGQLATILEMELFYDGQQRVDSVVISTEDPFFGGFGPLLSTKQVYDGDLLIQTRQWFYFALLGGWIPSGFTDYQYDGEGRLLDELTSVIDLSTGDVVPDTRTGYEYNQEGLLEIETEYFWEDPNWTPTQQFNYAYYNNGTIKDETRLIFDNGIFVNNVLTHYAVEEVDDQYPSTSYIWDPNVSAWIHTDSTISHLNPLLPWANVAAPTQLALLGAAGFESDFDYSGSSINSTEYFVWDSTGTQLFFANEDTYYYSLIGGTGISPVLPAHLSVTPNPSYGQFTITEEAPGLAEYAVFNATGVMIEQGIIEGGKQNVGTSSWLPGIYYVTIQLEDGQRYVQKQIVH